MLFFHYSTISFGLKSTRVCIMMGFVCIYSVMTLYLNSYSFFYLKDKYAQVTHWTIPIILTPRCMFIVFCAQLNSANIVSSLFIPPKVLRGSQRTDMSSNSMQIKYGSPSQSSRVIASACTFKAFDKFTNASDTNWTPKVTHSTFLK